MKNFIVKFYFLDGCTSSLERKSKDEETLCQELCKILNSEGCYFTSNDNSGAIIFHPKNLVNIFIKEQV